jgi:hypothetical protein
MQKPIWHQLIRYLICYVGWVVFIALFTGIYAGLDEWTREWVRWDSNWYKQIATEGYSPQEYKALAYPPGYPYLLKVLTYILPLSLPTTALLLNLICYFGALVIATELLCHVFQLPNRVLFFVATLSAPTGYFVFSVYSDFLFMLMLWGLLLLAIRYPDNRKSQIAQVVLLLTIPSIRIAGYSLFSWLVLRRWLALALVIPFSAWLYLNYVLTGDPLFFVSVQQRYAMPEGNIIDGFLLTFGNLHDIPTMPSWDYWCYYLQFIFLPAAYLIMLGAAIVWMARRGEYLLAISAASLLLISHYGSFWRSVIRYDMQVVPYLFVPLFFMATKHSSANVRLLGGFLIGVVVMGQLILQVISAWLLKQGMWAF